MVAQDSLSLRTDSAELFTGFDLVLASYISYFINCIILYRTCHFERVALFFGFEMY